MLFRSICLLDSLATIGGQDLKRVTWNILGRLYTDDVSHQINWKGVNTKKAFSQMSAKSLLFSKYIIRSNIDCLWRCVALCRQWREVKQGGVTLKLYRGRKLYRPTSSVVYILTTCPATDDRVVCCEAGCQDVNN